MGAVYTDISSAGWKVKRARLLVVEKKKCLLGMDLHRNLGIRTTQISAPKEESVNEVSPTSTDDWISDKWRSHFGSKYKHVFSRKGRSKNHVVNTNFHSRLVPIQEKGRRVPIHILDKVEK